MHSEEEILTVKDLSKIEGHAELEVTVRGNKVKKAKLKVSENKRFFIQASLGKQFSNVHQLVSRICGTCSMAHMFGSLEAVEYALGVKPSKQTLTLRRLALNGVNIRDHAMHLYLFCLPDIYGKDSVLDFPDEGPLHDLIHKAFDVKAVGNKLSEITAGRAVHAPFPAVGGFVKLPKKEDLKQVAKDLMKVRDAAIEFVDIFDKSDFKFESETQFVALTNDNYDFINGEITSSEGYCIPPFSYPRYLKRMVAPYSQAPGFEFEGEPYMVGALARMNMNSKGLHKDTKKDLKKYICKFPCTNVYHNNVAQAIEIVHCIDRSVELIEKLELKDERPPTIKPKACEGVGAVEAPRGTLYYNYEINSEGKIKHSDIVIPTSQNQIKMEKDLGGLVQDNLDKGVKKKEIIHNMETLIRAYDPCMSCATHFLKVKWL